MELNTNLIIKYYWQNIENTIENSKMRSYLKNAKYFHFLVMKNGDILSDNLGIKITCEVLFSLYKKYEIVIDISNRSKVRNFIEKNNIILKENNVFTEKIFTIRLDKKEILENMLNEKIINDLEGMRIRIIKNQCSIKNLMDYKHKLSFYKEEDYYRLCNSNVDILTWGLDYGDMEIVSFSLKDKDFTRSIKKISEKYNLSYTPYRETEKDKQ